VSLSMMLYAFMDRGTPYGLVVIPLVAQSTGQALAFPTMTAGIMSAVPLGKAGVGSAMNDTTRELGASLGVAVLGSVALSRFDARLGRVVNALRPDVRHSASESLASALDAIRRNGEGDAAQLTALAHDAFVSGLHLSMMVAAGVLLIAAAIVYRTLPATLNASTSSIHVEKV